MIGKIRYFFWSMAFSGAMLIYGVYTGNVRKMITTVSDVRTKRAAGLPTSYRENMPYFFHEVLPNFVKRKIPCHVWYNVDQLSEKKHYPDPAASSCTERDTVANTIGPPDEHGDYSGQPVNQSTAASVKAAKSKPRAPLVESKSATRDDIVQGNYVQIDGQYYQKRADHVYNVKNQKIYFENSRRYVMNDKEQNRITDINGDAVPDKSEAQGGDAKIARKVNAEDDTPETPTNTDEMIQVLKKAQMNQQTEEQMLKAIDQEK